jgi:acetyl esterase/lipase
VKSTAVRLLLAIVLVLALQSPLHAQSPAHTLPYVTLGGTPLIVDIYHPPTGAGPFPVVLWLHDGGWLTGDRRLPSFVAPLLTRGIAIASIDYRLTSEGGRYGAEAVTFPAQIFDTKGAIRWLRGHADGFRLDGKRIGVWGSSAGGHLAALAGTSGGVAALEDGAAGSVHVSSRVQAVVDYYGPTDLLNLGPDQTNPPGAAFDHDAPGGPASLLIGYSRSGEGLGTLRRNAGNVQPPYPAFLALARAANPITHIDALDPPTLIVHGDRDTQVALAQSRKLRDALVQAGVPADLVVVAGGEHGNFAPSVHQQAIDFLVARLTAATLPIGNPGGLAGTWYDPQTSGQGFQLQWLDGDRLLLVFYGHRDTERNLFLLGLRDGRPQYGQALQFALTATRNADFGDFDPDDVVYSDWGSATLTFSDCDHATAVLDGADGRQTLVLQRLTGGPLPRCD